MSKNVKLWPKFNELTLVLRGNKNEIEEDNKKSLVQELSSDQIKC